jgi:hypothetical protein
MKKAKKELMLYDARRRKVKKERLEENEKKHTTGT